MSTLPNIRLSGVLLAGGESRRMGRDKAGVELNGLPLWERQLGLLQSLALNDCMISGRRDGPYAGAGVPIIEDQVVGCGPIAGIVSALEESRQDGILVLAVDTPFVPAGFLFDLRNCASAARRSVIPRIDQSFEPMVAIYLKDALVPARNQLAAGDFKLQHLATSLIEKDLAIAYTVSAEQRGYFRNLNEPDDLTKV